MVNILVRHKVSDFRHWKEVFDQNLGMRKAGGELNCRIFHNHTDGSDLTLFFDWESLEMAKRFFDSDALKNRMQEAGVSGKSEIVILDEFRQLRRTSAD
jgi:hypothetical protein